MNRILVQKNRFVLGLVSSWGCSKGNHSLPYGGPDWAQIFIWAEVRALKLTVRWWWWWWGYKNLNDCKLEII